MDEDGWVLTNEEEGDMNLSHSTDSGDSRRDYFNRLKFSVDIKDLRSFQSVEPKKGYTNCMKLYILAFIRRLVVYYQWATSSISSSFFNQSYLKKYKENCGTWLLLSAGFTEFDQCPAKSLSP